jgi:predicted metal-dependent hydrolase
MHLQRGIELIRARAYFAAHEELELAWRAAEPAERDFYQGLVHVVVAWYQAGRGNRVGCERQLAKAQRRLAPYAPVHEGVDVGALLARVSGAAAQVAAGSLALDPIDPECFQSAVQRDLQPPVATEEEQ